MDVAELRDGADRFLWVGRVLLFMGWIRHRPNDELRMFGTYVSVWSHCGSGSLLTGRDEPINLSRSRPPGHSF